MKTGDSLSNRHKMSLENQLRPSMISKDVQKRSSHVVESQYSLNKKEVTSQKRS